MHCFGNKQHNIMLHRSMDKYKQQCHKQHMRDPKAWIRKLDCFKQLLQHMWCFLSLFLKSLKYLFMKILQFHFIFTFNSLYFALP